MFFHSPFDHPQLVPILIRLAFFLGLGLLIVIAFNKGNRQNFFQSETWLRYVGWLLMTPPFLFSVFCGGIISILFIGFVMYRGIIEYSRILLLPRFFYLLLLFNALITILFITLNPKWVPVLPIIYFLITVLATVLRNQLENILVYVSLTLFGSIWLPYCLGHFLLTGRLENGVNILITIGFSVAFSDIFAFVFGKIFAKFGFGTSHKIAHLISPNKTYAGILGNIFGASLALFAYSFLHPQLTSYNLWSLGILIGISAVLGDLSESMIKRFASVKDSGHSIPGHGGILDRIDSLLIVSVTTHYFFLLAG
ncbi:MAG: hypothetical protein CMO81_06705 [Waddliaceae bacterium]|nr:hypothetical protein [Waddliaceae bacterium]